MSACLTFGKYVSYPELVAWLKGSMGYYQLGASGLVRHEDVLSISYVPYMDERAHRERMDRDEEFMRTYIIPRTSVELELNANSKNQAGHLTELFIGGWDRFGGDVELEDCDTLAAQIRDGVLNVRPTGRLEWPYDVPSNLEYLQRLWSEARSRRGGAMR